MKRCGIILVLVCAFFVVQATARDQRIRFPRGATSATVAGQFRNPRETHYFSLRGRGGQHMRVEIHGNGPTRGVVLFPSGGQDGQPGGLIFDDDLPETGNYRIRVTEDTMAEPWKGRFTVTVVIK